MKATTRRVVVAGTAAAIVLSACARLGAQVRSKSLDVDGPGGKLFVDDGGSGGIPVLFVHSFGGSAAHWTSQLRHERRRRRAIAMDLRAHGKSDAPISGEYEIGSFANDIGAVADALGIERFVLVGHSLGGAAAIRHAAEHPDRVAGLVLVGAPGKIPPQQSEPIMAAMEADYRGVTGQYWDKLTAGAQPRVREQLLGEMGSIPKQPALAIMRATFADDPLASLARYHGPKLVIYTPQGDTPNDLQNALPDMPRQRIEGTSHWPHMDKPGEFNRILDQFLASVS
jgi:pimeloyl-ACP methyl ester carboxylesterase